MSNQKPRPERHGVQDSVRRKRPLLAAAGIAGLVLVGCGSGTTDAGPVSSVVPTGGPTQTGTVSTAVGTTTAAGSTATGSDGGAAAEVSAEAELRTPGGEQIGIVNFAVEESVVTVSATVNNLPPGFKGFHVHSIGKCESNSPDPKDPARIGDFLSAGGHLGADSAAHPGHQGDLTSLEVRADGSAQLVTTTDAFDMEAVLDADGSAVMVHAGPDNFANIPTRYAPSGPDAMSQATGDSGGRAACGVVEAID